MFAHYSIPAFDNGRTPSHEAGSAIQSTKFVVPEEVVLLSKLNPETPRVWLPYRDSSLPAVCSTEFLVCQARAPARPAYLYCLFGDRDFQGEFGGRVTGTSKSHQRVRPQDLKSIRVVVPDREVVGAFVNRVQPWFELVESAWRESKTLLALRETLATKLLSGELRVREAEKLVEQAV